MKFDLAIIGGGPAGYVAAERAGAKKLSVVLFEKKKLGGVCLNEGCIPTKSLLYSAKILETCQNASKYGVNTIQTSFEYPAMLKRKDKLVKKMVNGVGAKMKHHQICVVHGAANILGRTKDGIKISAGKEEYQCKDLLICTGSEALIPPIEGLDMAKHTYLTNKEILELEELPKSLIVIGGGVIGIEFASFYNSLGVEVSVLEMTEKILGDMDDEYSLVLQKMFSDKGVKFHLNAMVTIANGGEITFKQNGKNETIKAEKVLLSTGRKPVTEGFGLEKLGVELHQGGIKTDELMRTNIPNVYAAGDVTGQSLLAHTASREGEVVINNLTGRKDRVRYNAIPWVVYTNPEFSAVGHTEKSASLAGIPFKVKSLPMAYAGRFMVENEGGEGYCKILVGEKHGEIIGVHMLGNPSSEMIHGAAMAIENEMTLDEMQEIIFPHPTVSEIVKETIFTF